MTADSPSPRGESLQHRVHALDGVAAGVAHEFNNVLQIVRGYVAFTRDSLPLGSAERGDLDNALTATDRAADLASRLLQVARADEGPQYSDASDALVALGVLLKPIIGENVRLRIEPPSEPLYVAADDGSLRRALLNLCVNARDAMPDGGEINLSAKTIELDKAREVSSAFLEPGTYGVITVIDTGTGMPPEVQARVFEPFYSTKPEGAGTGLGLVVVGEFTERFAGGVDIQSESGAGCQVSLLLPLAETDEYGEPIDRPAEGEIVTTCGGRSA